MQIAQWEAELQKLKNPKTIAAPVTNELSKYEQQRAANIRQNEEMLSSLGLIPLNHTIEQEQKRKPYKPREKKIYEQRDLPKRSTRSNKPYVDDIELPREPIERKPRSTLRQARVKDDVCMLAYDDLPDWIREKYPLRHSGNDSGYYYVHRGSKCWQTQIHVNKSLVHHGMFNDVKVAALAQSIARNELSIAQISNGGRSVIENASSLNQDPGSLQDVEIVGK